MGFSKRDDTSSCSDDSSSDVFKSIQKNKNAFCVWKIEGLRAISIRKEKMGIFFSESAYIIYTVSSKNGPLPYPGVPEKEVKEDFAIRAVHFWIGSKCDSTMSGAVALRAAELDSQVSATILSREAQGRESSRFLAYFRDQLIVQNFHTEKPSCTLHKISGLTVPILTELDGLSWSNFTSRDVIIIDMHSRNIVFLWLGLKAEILHKKHAATILKQRKENETQVFIIDDGYERTLPNEVRKLLNDVLNLSNRNVIPENQHSSPLPSPVKLYKCSEQTGKYKVAEVKSGPIFRKDFSSESVFLIDRGEIGIWAWVGKNVNAREKLEAVRNARGFVKKKNYSVSVPVTRAIEGQEPVEMKTLIKGWGQKKARPLTLPSCFEPEYMTERPRMAAECQLVDDGSGEKTLWRVNQQTGMIEVEDRGIYYAEMCYVMRYKYGYGRRSRLIVYCWEGAHSSCGDRETALVSACLIADEISAQLVKASQGNEPPHLLQIYKGKLTILAGSYKNNPPSKYLVRVFGSTPYTSKAVERSLRASSLDSSGVFVLFSNSPMVWCGSRSTGDAREASRRLAPSSAPLISEGNEDEEFWSQLEGRGEYGTEFMNDEEEQEKHLYHCQIEQNIFVGEEVLGFSQSSLLPEAIWLLDAGNVIWLWIGIYSANNSLKECVERGKIFLYTHPAGRDRNTPISIIKQGLEPPSFIGLFENWNHNFLRDYQSFDALRSFIEDKEPSINNSLSNKLITDFNSHVKYPLKILKSDPENLPNEVDVSRKEMHLTYDDFMTVFKMEPNDFEKLPAWRRQRLKQAAGLF
ncbi:villin-1 isoform X2 [Leptopilina boulardi]|uniref:villin-1 isoform X2 n=1 Tax=Leptopilina boulardi TaxID=63433 RepID=UPI0021F6448F|nr:villin-1 isoform X2 [Leptopilina boulardi]